MQSSVFGTTVSSLRRAPLVSCKPGHVTSVGIESCTLCAATERGSAAAAWLCMQGYAWAEDKEHCEEYGRMLSADPTKVSQRAKKRGLPQVARLDSLYSTPC